MKKLVLFATLSLAIISGACAPGPNTAIIPQACNQPQYAGGGCVAYNPRMYGQNYYNQGGYNPYNSMYAQIPIIVTGKQIGRASCRERVYVLV